MTIKQIEDALLDAHDKLNKTNAGLDRYAKHANAAGTERETRWWAERGHGERARFLISLENSRRLLRTLINGLEQAQWATAHLEGSIDENTMIDHPMMKRG